VPWPHYLNKNVFSNRLNWLYDSPHSLRLGGRLFQTSGPAAAKVPSPKLLLSDVALQRAMVHHSS